jgi:predicted peptidase
VVEEEDGEIKIFFQKGGEPTKAMHMLLSLTDSLRSQKFVDRRRIYVGGLSMGGMGTFEILRRRSHVFAAGFPICGGDHIENVRNYRKVPVWIFHGIMDDVVPFMYSKFVADELRKLRSKKVRLTLFPQADHNSWDPAFEEPELLHWLFSKKR